MAKTKAPLSKNSNGGFRAKPRAKRVKRKIKGLFTEQDFEILHYYYTHRSKKELLHCAATLAIFNLREEFILKVESEEIEEDIKKSIALAIHKAIHKSEKKTEKKNFSFFTKQLDYYTNAELKKLIEKKKIQPVTYDYLLSNLTDKIKSQHKIQHENDVLEHITSHALEWPIWAHQVAEPKNGGKRKSLGRRLVQQIEQQVEQAEQLSLF